MEQQSDRRWARISIILQIASLCCILIPFVRFNNLLEWDFPGHYAAILQIRNHLFPWHSGWNSFFYCGYPQGIFYPPLAHYLAAILSYFLGISGAMKALICLSLLSLPIAFYCFSRRWHLDRLQAAVCSAWMTAQLFLCGEIFGTTNFGSDLKAILNAGLFANALSLPILFFFLAYCGVKTENWKKPALLLGILVLIHPLSTLIAGLFWASNIVCQFMQRSQDRCWSALIRIAGIGLLIGALWIMPFIYFRSFMNPETIPANWPLALQFIIFNGIILAISHYSKEELRPIAVTYIILANFIIVGAMWRINFQFPRLTIYLLFLLPLFFIKWLKSKVLLVSAGMLAIVVGAYGYFNGGMNPKGVPGFSMPDFGKVQGRILSVTPYSHLPSTHVHHDLIPIRTGNKAILGLFIESTINGRYMGNLTRLMDRNAYVWGTPTEALDSEYLGNDYPQYLKDRLRLFGISHIYTDLKLENTVDPVLAKTKRYINSYPIPRVKRQKEYDYLCAHYNVSGDQFDFYLYDIGESPVAEALPYVPKSPQSDWKMTNTIWFTQMRGVPIFTDRPAPANVRGSNDGEWVEFLNESRNSDRLEFQVHATHDIPVFIKIGYFPNWVLKVNEEERPIYRASPDLMLIYGKGHVVLEYKRSWVEYFGILLSILGLALLFLLR